MWTKKSICWEACIERKWLGGVHRKEMARRRSDEKKRNFRLMKDFGLGVGLRKFIVCLYVSQ